MTPLRPESRPSRFAGVGPLALPVLLAGSAAALAAPGEIVVTRTLRDILVGTEWTFAERAAVGEMALYALAVDHA